VFHLHLHIMGGRQLVSGHRPLRPQLDSVPMLLPTACILVNCVGQVGHLLQQHDKQPITSLFTGLATRVIQSAAQMSTDQRFSWPHAFREKGGVANRCGTSLLWLSCAATILHLARYLQQTNAFEGKHACQRHGMR
jgi:hypothetical protein